MCKPMKLIFSASVCLAVLFTNCSDTTPKRKFGPIVLGDSSTIVTETDPQYLVDNIEDFSNKRVVDTVPKKDTTIQPLVATQIISDTLPSNAASTKDSSILAPSNKTPQIDYKKGAVVHFDNISVQLLNLLSNKNEVKVKNNVSLAIKKGQLKTAQLKIWKGQVDDYYIKYATSLHYTFNGKSYALTTLKKHVTNWEKINVDKATLFGQFVDNHKTYPKISASNLQSAAKKATQRIKLSTADKNQLSKSINSIKSVQSNAIQIKVDYVIIQLETLNGGKKERFEVRMDL